MDVKRRILALVVALAAVRGAAADEVVLKNGATFSGVVREAGDSIVLEVDIGTMTFRKAEVRSITKTADPIKELEQKVLAATDAKGYFEAGVWAKEKGLTTRANELFRKTLALQPDHEGARRSLGYERVDGRWLEGDDLMMAKGFLKYNGRWFPKDTVERMQENDKQVLIETDRRNTETRIAELQQQVEMAKVKLERERLERERIERERRERDDWWRWGWTGMACPYYGRTAFTIPPPSDPRMQPAPVFIPGPAPVAAPRR